MRDLWFVLIAWIVGCSSTVTGGGFTAGAGGEGSAGAQNAAGTPGVGGSATGGSGQITAGSGSTGGAAAGGAGGAISTCSADVSACGTLCPVGYYKASGNPASGECSGDPSSHCVDPCEQPRIYVCDENNTCPPGYIMVSGSAVRNCNCGSCLSMIITCTLI